MNTSNFQPPEDNNNPYSGGIEKIQPSPYDDTPYSANTEEFQSPYQPGQFQPTPYAQQRRRRRTFSQWYSAQRRFAKIGLGCLPFYLAFILCIGGMIVYTSTLPQPPAQKTPATLVTNNNPTNLSLATATPTTLPATLPTATPTTAPPNTDNRAISDTDSNT